jgi:hypothetical protein
MFLISFLGAASRAERVATVTRPLRAYYFVCAARNAKGEDSMPTDLHRLAARNREARATAESEKSIMLVSFIVCLAGPEVDVRLSGPCEGRGTFRPVLRGPPPIAWFASKPARRYRLEQTAATRAGPAYFLVGRTIGLTPACSSAVYGDP